MQELQLIPIKSKPEQNADSELPNVFQLPHGLLYSRWLILSALFDMVLSYAGYVSWYSMPCPSDNLNFLNVFCEIHTWGFIEQCLLIWGIFLSGWLFSFLVGYLFIENSKDSHGAQKKDIGRFLGSISNFEHFRWPLLIYALIIFLSVLITGRLKGILPIPFALAMIVLFVLIWTWCNNILKKEPEQEAAKPVLVQVIVLEKPLYTAAYLFCCLFRIRVRGRRKSDKPGTTIAGMH